MLGNDVGSLVGLAEGVIVSAAVGVAVGDVDGVAEGETGAGVGDTLGDTDGKGDGAANGAVRVTAAVGIVLGAGLYAVLGTVVSVGKVLQTCDVYDVDEKSDMQLYSPKLCVDEDVPLHSKAPSPVKYVYAQVPTRIRKDKSDKLIFDMRAHTRTQPHTHTLTRSNIPIHSQAHTYKSYLHL